MGWFCPVTLAGGWLPIAPGMEEAVKAREDGGDEALVQKPA